MTDEQFIHTGMLHESLELLVHRIISAVEGEQLSDLKKEFHNRLRITQTPTDKTDLIEDIWDYFYDWCVFEQHLPDTIPLEGAEAEAWSSMKGTSVRGLFTVARVADSYLKLKELYSRQVYIVTKRSARDLMGISRADIIECRLLESGEGRKKEYQFIRKPSYHPREVHAYIKRRIKEHKKAKDEPSYQHWLWLLVGMDLKHRFYPQMPVDKIYDDNSRI